MFTLSDKKIKAFAESCRSIGQVFFATVLLEPIMSEQTHWYTVILGIVLSVCSFYAGILFADYKPIAIIKL
jgi:hypothetical protein